MTCCLQCHMKVSIIETTMASIITSRRGGSKIMGVNEIMNPLIGVDRNQATFEGGGVIKFKWPKRASYYYKCDNFC